MYCIEATNHGLWAISCDISQALFGQWAGVEDQSQPFETLAAAEAAIAVLESTGDWPDGRPDYEIVEVE